MTNALRHTPLKGRIEIQVKQEQDESLIRVFNTGIPIPENESEMVFDRLYRGEYARKTPGTGFGLSIANKIVELHEGSIPLRLRNKEQQ